MKLFITLTTLLFLSSSYGCPDLSGRYHCADEGEGRDFEITQKQEPENGTTTYLLKYDDGNITEFIEGSVTVIIGVGDIFSITIVSCEDQKLISQENRSEPDDTWNYDQIEQTFSKKGNSLLKSTTVKLKGDVVNSTNTYCPPIGKIGGP